MGLLLGTKPGSCFSRASDSRVCAPGAGRRASQTSGCIGLIGFGWLMMRVWHASTHACTNKHPIHASLNPPTHLGRVANVDQLQAVGPGRDAAHVGPQGGGEVEAEA